MTNDEARMANDERPMIILYSSFLAHGGMKDPRRTEARQNSLGKRAGLWDGLTVTRKIYGPLIRMLLG